jgi:hypothetical protein
MVSAQQLRQRAAECMRIAEVSGGLGRSLWGRLAEQWLARADQISAEPAGAEQKSSSPLQEGPPRE